MEYAVNVVSNVTVAPAKVVLSTEGPIKDRICNYLNPHTCAVIGLKPRVPPNTKYLVTTYARNLQALTSRSRGQSLG